MAFVRPDVGVRSASGASTELMVFALLQIEYTHDISHGHYKKKEPIEE